MPARSVAAPGCGCRCLTAPNAWGCWASPLSDRAALDVGSGLLGVRLRRFASIVAELVVSKTLYGDTIVRTRRRSQMGLAAEMQWAMLPPLTFANQEVVVAGVLEPAYKVAGDSLDYAVDLGRARFAVFDGMGHGLQSASRCPGGLGIPQRPAFGAVPARRPPARLTGMSTSPSTVRRSPPRSSRATPTQASCPGSAQATRRLLLRQGQLVKSLHVSPGLPFGLGLRADLSGMYPVGRQQLRPEDQAAALHRRRSPSAAPDARFFELDRLVRSARHLAGGPPMPETMRRRCGLRSTSIRTSCETIADACRWSSGASIPAQPHPPARRPRGPGAVDAPTGAILRSDEHPLMGCCREPIAACESL